MIRIFFIALLIWNVFAFLLMGFDKKRAEKGGERVSEKVLLTVSFLLGGPGTLLGALVWHHKTRKLKFRLGIPASLVVNALILVLVLNALVVATTAGNIAFKCKGTSEIEASVLEDLKAEDYQCALVLGCGVYADGTPTPMLRDRLEVGIRLYNEGVVPKLLLSGDHGQVEYNEIGCMYRYCLEAGIPEEDIFLDHAGFSTYDSMHRAKSIFCVERAIVVTQTYHEFRALYIGEAMGIKVTRVASDQQRYAGFSLREAREILARDKDFFKALFKASPYYGGEEIPITGPVDKSHE